MRSVSASICALVNENISGYKGSRHQLITKGRLSLDFLIPKFSRF